MIKKILASVILISSLIVLLFPSQSFAVNSYKFQYFNDENANNRFDQGEEGSDIYRGCYDGLVPCGKKVGVVIYNKDLSEEEQCQRAPVTKGIVHCQLCHVFVMINGIINYIFIDIIPWLAIFMFVIGGVMFYFGGAKPELTSKAKSLIKSVAIGLGLAYSSFLIVGLFLTVLGAAEVGPVKEVWDSDHFFKINCPVRVNEKLKP